MGAAAAGRRTVSQIGKGFVIQAERNADGDLVKTTRRRDVITATVTDKTIAPRGQFDRQSRYVIHTDQGNTVPVSASTTFTLVSEPVEQAAPAEPVAVTADQAALTSEAPSPGELRTAYETARELALMGDAEPPTRTDMRPRTETFRGRKLRVTRGQSWGTIDMTVNGVLAGSTSGTSPAAMDRAAAQLRRDVLNADERRVTDPDAFPAAWFKGATELPTSIVAYTRYRAEQDARDRAALAAVTCADQDHVPGVIGHPSPFTSCNGVPADAASLTVHEIAGTARTGFDEVGQELRARLAETLPGVGLLSTGETPWDHRAVRRFAVWQIPVSGRTVTVVHYEGRNPGGDPRSYVAVLIDGQLIDGASDISAAQPAGELTRFLAYRIGDAIRVLPTGDQAHEIIPTGSPVQAVIERFYPPVAEILRGSEALDDARRAFPVGAPVFSEPDDAEAVVTGEPVADLSGLVMVAVRFQDGSDAPRAVSDLRDAGSAAPTGSDTDPEIAREVAAANDEDDNDEDGGGAGGVDRPRPGPDNGPAGGGVNFTSWPQVRDHIFGEHGPAIVARPAPAVTPVAGDMVTVAGWSVRGFVLGVLPGGRVAVDVVGEISRLPLHLVTGVETLTGGEVAETARQRLAEPHGVPSDLVDTVRMLAERPVWTSGNPESCMLIPVLALDDTAGVRRENVLMLAEVVTKLGCGCYRIECYRPGPADPAENGHRRWVAFRTGCSWHESQVSAPVPTPDVPAAGLGGWGTQDGWETIGDSSDLRHPETGVQVVDLDFFGNPIGQCEVRRPAADRVGYVVAGAADYATVRALADATVEQVRAEQASGAAEAATSVPAAQEVADIRRVGAESLTRTLAAHTDTAEKSAELAAPGETDPAARWEFLGRMSAFTGDVDRARWVRYVAAIRRVHNLPDDISHDDMISARDADPRPWAEKCAAYWDTYAAMMAEEGAERTAAAEPYPALAPAPGVRPTVTVRPWVTAHLAEQQCAELDTPAVDDTPAAPETSASVDVEPPADGQMKRRPAVGAYIWHREHGVCEVVAVHGRGGEDIGVRTADGERLSLTRGPRKFWHVVPAPTGYQVDSDDAPTGGEPGSIYQLPVQAYAPELDSDPDAELTITHDHESGTMLDGSAPGDGVWEIVKRCGMEYRRTVGIFRKYTRDHFADLTFIGKLAVALREGGHTVAVQIDDVWRPAADREEARAERAEDRSARLGERAERQFAEAHARRMAARAIGDRMPFGEPVKKGHHSERAHLAAFAKIERNDRASFAARDYAEHLANRADAAERNEAAKQQPRAIMRRVETLESERRRWVRRLADTDKGTTGYARRCRLHIEMISEDIAFQLAKLGDMAASGAFVAWSAETLRKGDRVKTGFGWRTVARINRKGVSVTGLYHGDGDTVRPVTWDQIYGRRRDGQQLDAPNGTPWPVEQADQVELWANLVSRYETCTSYDSGDTATVFKRIHVAQARRIVLGLGRKATAQEVAAFGQPDTVEAQRARALASLDAFERLEAGETFDQVAAAITPPFFLNPKWWMPQGEPVDMPPKDLVIGDIVAGVIDGFATMRTISTAIVGPVETMPKHEDRHESGDWWHVTINGESHEIRSSRWLKVHPTGAR